MKKNRINISLGRRTTKRTVAAPTLKKPVAAIAPVVEKKVKSVIKSTGLDKAEREAMLARPEGRRIVIETVKDKWYAGTLTKVVDGEFFLVVFDDRTTYPKVTRFENPYYSRIRYIVDPNAKKVSKVLTFEQAQTLCAYDYSSIVDIVRQIVDHYQDLTQLERNQILMQVMHRALHFGLTSSTSVPVQNTFVYSAIGLSPSKFKQTVHNQHVAFPRSKFSMWTKDPATCGKYLNNFNYGVVIEWMPPKSAIALTLSTVLSKIKDNDFAVAKLGSASEQKRFHALVERASKSNDLILRSAPLDSPVIGVVTTSSRFRKQCVNMDIPVTVSPDGRSVFVRLFHMKDALYELGL
jgi:hypothetical protein